MKSSDNLKEEVKEILDHIDSRDRVAGLCWMDPSVEPLEFFLQNMKRKLFIAELVFYRDGLEAGKEVLRDTTLDLLGYSILWYWRVKNQLEC